MTDELNEIVQYMRQENALHLPSVCDEHGESLRRSRREALTSISSSVEPIQLPTPSDS